MNAQKYTQKSLEAIQAAQQLTIENQNQQIEQVHLLASLLRQENGLAPQLLRKMGITVESLDAAVLQELGKLPRVTGSGREADKYYVARASRRGAQPCGENCGRDEGRLRLRRASAACPDRDGRLDAQASVFDLQYYKGALLCRRFSPSAATSA